MLAAVGTGVAVAGVFALLVVVLGTDQIITGTAITLGAVGLTGAVYRQAYGAAGAGLSLPTFAPAPLPFLHRIPVLGPGLFEQPLPGYLAFVLVPLVWWALFRTRWGLTLRAAGESPTAAAANGVRSGL